MVCCLNRMAENKNPTPTEEEEEEDPFYTIIEKSGCSKYHYALQDCYAETRDWRKCKKEMQDFQACTEAQRKLKNRTKSQK